MVYLLLLINVSLLVSGQILWKMAVTGIEQWSVSTIIGVILSPLFIGGATLYVIATGIWLVILSKLPISVAYPSQSIGYVFGAVLALFIFRETISPTQWCGMAVIIFGVYLVAK